jgi:hypothetical protein
MTSAWPSLNVVAGEGANTRIHYQMSSGGRKLKEADVVLAGRLGARDIETIKRAVEQGGGFMPEDAGIPHIAELMPLSWSPSGDETHHISRIGFTSSKPSAGCLEAAQFAATFEPAEAAPAMAM